MKYEFKESLERWKSENETGILNYYHKKYEHLKPGTVISYNGYLNNFKSLSDLLNVVGAHLPQNFEWSKVPEDDEVSLNFHANGELSEYTLDVYYSEKYLYGEPDAMIVSSKGSLTPEQFSSIRTYLSIDGKMEAIIFTGFSQSANVDFFDELSIDDFVCLEIVRM